MNPESSPLISVVIPTYNRHLILISALKSVMAQDYPNWEVIIVDDGSTDNTEREIQPYLQDERIRFYKTANQGASHARNVGIRNAKGEYVSFLDSDDFYEPRRLSLQLQRMKQVGVEFSISGRKLVNGNTVSFDEEVEGPLTMKDALTGQIPLSTSLFLLSKQIAEEVLFDENLASGQDFDFVLRALKNNQIALIGEHLTVIYKTIGFSRISTDFRAVAKGRSAILEKLIGGYYDIEPEYQTLLENKLNFAVGLYWFLGGESNQAKGYLKQYCQSGAVSGPRRILATMLYWSCFVPLASYITGHFLVVFWKKNSDLVNRVYLKFSR